MSSTATHGDWHAAPGYRLAPLVLAAVGLCFYILRATNWFTAVPGDLGDARFNSVILEHLFQRASGDWPSLWSPGFFYPAPGALAFSDNHFGSGLVYVIFRALGLAREPALDAWLTVGFGLDFVAMYLVMRRLGFSSLAASVAAFVYTFSLPALAQEPHAQLTYRFAIPLAWLALLQFVQERRLTHLARLAAWGALQFYCSIYLGVFMAYLLAATAVAMLVPAFRPPAARRRPGTSAGLFDWTALLVIGASAAAVGYLLLKYLAISRVYGFSRMPDEVLVMLPRPQSYLLADAVPGYRWIGAAVSGLEARNEHQMFFGFVPLVLALWALVTATTEAAARWRRLLGLSLAALALLVAFTLHVNGQSLYQHAMALPGISSLRAVSRVVLVMTLPVAVMAAIGVEHLQRRRGLRWLVSSLVVLAFSLETLAYRPSFTGFDQWRGRMAAVEQAAGATAFKPDAVLYLTGRAKEPFYMTELDGMVFAQDRRMPTLNGYSGNAPPGYIHPLPCHSAAARIYSMAPAPWAAGRLAPEALLARTAWVSLEPCPGDHLPTDAAPRPPDEAQARQIQLAPTATEADARELKVVVRIRNDSAQPLHSLSRVGHPLRLTWRFVPTSADPAAAAPVPGWLARQDLNFSLAPGEEEAISVTIPKPSAEGTYDLQFSIAAEGYRYLHEMDMPVPHIPVVAGPAAK